MQPASPRQTCAPPPAEQVPAILLTGATGFLGGHFLLHRVKWPGDVYAIVRGDSVEQARARLYAHLSECAASYRGIPGKSLLDSRLHVLTGDITAPLCGLGEEDIARLKEAGVRQFWHCAASLKFEDRHRQEIFEQNVGGTGNMLELFQRTCQDDARGGQASPEFVYISTAYSAGKVQGDIPEERHPPDRDFNNAYEESKNLAENTVVDYCQSHGLSYRVLRPSIVMGPLATHHSGTTRFGVYGFTREVHRLRTTLKKMQGRLKMLGVPQATANLTPVDECVRDMLQLSAGGFGEQRFFHLCNPHGVAMPELISMIDVKAGADRLEFVSERQQDASPMQELFDERTRFYAGYYNAEKVFLRSAPPQPQVTWSDVGLYLDSFIKELEQEEARGVGFKSQTVTARDGATLRVFSHGDASAPPLFLVNAYGMPAEFFWPLAQRLQDQFHVITWECRWVPGIEHPFDPADCGSTTHARDLLDIQQALELPQAGVAGWSSGAQIALRAMGLYPERIHSGVLLNPGVSIRPSESVRLTRFESGIRSLFDKIADNYRMAEKYCELIYGAETGDSSDNRLLSGILTSTDPYLLYMTSMPFRTPESLYRYANMMRTLFAEREDAWTGDVTQPVQVYVGDKDMVTHPDLGKALCDGLRHGQLHHDGDGDHFSHYYDQRIADLLCRHLMPEPVGVA